MHLKLLDINFMLVLNVSQLIVHTNIELGI